jgi:hypothetical protein
MSNSANITVYLVDTSGGDFDSTQIDSAHSAIDGLTGVPGNDQDATVENTDDQNINPADGTVSNPIMVVEIQSTSQMEADGCSGDVACTSSYLNSTGTVIGSKTYVSSAYATTYLQQVLTHEFGHGDFGWNDCTADNCYNGATIMNADFYSTEPSAPTSCDKQHCSSCGR